MIPKTSCCTGTERLRVSPPSTIPVMVMIRLSRSHDDIKLPRSVLSQVIGDKNRIEYGHNPATALYQQLCAFNPLITIG